MPDAWSLDSIADLEASSEASGVTFNVTECTVAWVHQTSRKLDWASRKQPALLPTVLPADTCIAILAAAARVLSRQPTLVHITPPEDVSVTVVGDLHGALHDFLHMLRVAGEPSPTSWYIFNGDYVDRGIWSIELLTVLAAWKLALPTQVTMLRGDHESAGCSAYYGLKMELKEKYGSSYKRVYRACKLLFKELPLMYVAACIRKATTTACSTGHAFTKPRSCCMAACGAPPLMSSRTTTPR